MRAIVRFVLALGLVLTLVAGAWVAIGAVSVASAGADDFSLDPSNQDWSSNLCGLQFCPPDPPPNEPSPPYIQVTAWSYNAGSGGWEQASAGLPPVDLVGDEYRLLAQLREDDGTLIPGAEVAVTVSDGSRYKCEPVAAEPAPLPPGGQRAIRLRYGDSPCDINVVATIDGTSYYTTRRMDAVQLSPGLTWLSAGGVPIDVGAWQSLGVLNAGDKRTFGLHTNDPLGVLGLSSADCTVEPVADQVGGTRYFRISALSGATTCSLQATTQRSPASIYDPYMGEARYATLTVGPGIWFGWLPGWEPPVAFSYPSGPVAVKAGADFTSVNLTSSGPCTVTAPAIYGADPWLITPTGVGDCVLTITALIIDLDNPESSLPALTYPIPVLPAAPANSAPQAAFDIVQPSTGAPSAVQLDASSSSDPDGDPLTYVWDFGDGTGGSGPTASTVFSRPGTYAVTLTVSDDEGATDTTAQTVTVTDATPPVITPIVQGKVGNDGWYTADVRISWQVDDPESTVTSTTGCDPVTVADDTGPNGTTVTCSATSGGGTRTIHGTFGRDATPPSLEPTVTPAAIPLGGTATVDANAADAASGVASATCGALDTSTIGTRSVTCTATDDAGNTAQETVTYTVVLGWQGLRGPVDAPPVLNRVQPGRGVPVSFSLGAYRGLHIFAAGSPSSRQVPCPAGAPSDPIGRTPRVKAPTLTFDAATATYTYTWPTSARWRGTCRELRIRLIDGTEHVALFSFR